MGSPCAFICPPYTMRESASVEILPPDVTTFGWLGVIFHSIKNSQRPCYEKFAHLHGVGGAVMQVVHHMLVYCCRNRFKPWIELGIHVAFNWIFQKTKLQFAELSKLLRRAMLRITTVRIFRFLQNCFDV